MAGGIGGFISGLFGSENEDKAAKPAIDSNAYNYGGYEGGATDAAMRYRENARNAQSRDAAQANYAGANRMNNMGLAARGDMNQVGQAQLARALGKVPSIAQMQGDRQMGQAVAAQGAMQASARGRGGLANAGMAAAANTANAQAGISNQTQINAAHERAQAEQAAAGTFANMQGLDAQRTGMAAQMSQYQATNQMQQRELNDRMTSDMLKNEMGVQGMQLGASQNLQAQNSANSLGAAGINAGVGGQNANMNQQNGMAAIGMGAQVAGGLATGGGSSVTGKADGGPVKGGKPYVMGERGPEMVIDLDEPVIDLDDEMDADAYLESKVPGPMSWEDLHMRRDTPADQRAVKRGVEDKAGRDADAMMAAFQAGLAAGPAVASRLNAQPDERIAARATGGPVEGGKPYLVGENGPEIVRPQQDGFVVPSEITVPMLAQSTWGKGGQLSAEGQQIAGDENELRREHIARAEAENAKYVDPYQRVINREKAGRAAGLTPSEDDGRDGERLSSAAEERYAKQMVRRKGGIAGATQPAEEKADPEEKAAVAEGKALPKKGKLSAALGTVQRGAEKMAGGVDTAYHGPTSIAGPQLIPVQARAMGGPVTGGQPYLVGEQGPELMAPKFSQMGVAGGAMGQGGAGAPTSFDKLSGGGMDVLGSLKAHSNFATKFQRDPSGGMVAGARADGGEVESGKPYLVGERGPEAVMPTAKLTPEQEAAKEAAVQQMRARMQKEHEDYVNAPRSELSPRPIEQARDAPPPAKQENGALVAAKQALTPSMAPIGPQQSVTPLLMPLSSFLSSILRGR